MSKPDLILHPIRLRILTVLGGRALTPSQIAAGVPNVPQTTLYRHINALVEGQVLRVVEERPVRGTVERVYAIIEGAARLSAAEFSALSKDDHVRYLTIYLASLLQDFSAYLDRCETAGIAPDGMVYNKATLMLSDAEYQELTSKVRDFILGYAGLADDGTRKPYIFGLMTVPDE